MKKILVACISFFILIVLIITLIIVFKKEEVVKNEEKLQIIATLFPQYDFAKHIVGDKAEVKLLLNSGVETHNYEPTPKDMISINNSDMFLYTGNDLEPWTESIINAISDECEVIDISEEIELITIEEFEEKHINSNIVYDEHIHADQEDESHHHEEIYDGHIWLNPLNAIKMIDNITESICKIDLENAEYYRQNAENYKKEILLVDSELENIVNNATKKEIAVGGEFAYAYLVERYDLNFVSVYNNCGDGEDPSISKVKSVIDYINENNMKVVFYEELTEGTVAKMIAEETSAESLVLYSIHNADIEKDTYISLLKKNLENLKQALS